MQLVKDAVDAWVFHYKAGNLNWPMIIYIGLVHVAAIVGVLTIPYCHKLTLFMAFILWPIT